MKKLILFFLILFSTHSLLAADSNTYFRFDYGKAQFSNDSLDDLKAKPSGNSFGFSAGSKFKYIEAGLFYKNFSLASDIIHDSAANQIIHKGKTFGFDLSVFLNSHLSLKVGLAVNNYKQSFANGILNTDALESANSMYEIENDHTSTNIYYGINFDIFGTKSWDLYTSITQFPMGDGKNTLSAQLGIRLYINKSISDFFGQ